jgi:hypothetical protein
MEEYLDLLFTESSGGLVELNKEAKLLEGFREIISRDPGRIISGEKVKEIARKEISFIYFYLKSAYFEGYKDEERKEMIRIRVGLPDKWKADKIVLKIIEDIRLDAVTKFEKILKLAEKNLEDYLVVYEEINDYTRKIITLLKDTDVEKASDDDLHERKEAIDQAKEYAKTLTTSLQDLQKNFTLIQSLRETIKVNKKKEERKRISRSETDHSLYKRNAQF